MRYRRRFMIGLTALCVLAGCQPGATRLAGQEAPVILHQAAVTAPDRQIRLSASLPELNLTVEGEDYILPMSLSELFRDGWKLDPAFCREMVPAAVYVEGVRLIRGNRMLQVIVGSPTAESIALRQAMVVGISTIQSAEPPEVIAVPGLNLGMTEEAARQLLGISAEPAASEGIHRADDGEWRLRFTDGRLTGWEVISLCRLIDGVDLVTVRPPRWGEDPTTGRVLVDGALYRLPASLSQFESVGWTLGRTLEYLMPGSESLVRLDQAEAHLTVTVINPTDEIQAIRNCPVIALRPASPQSGLAMALTRTVRTGMAMEEAIGFAAPYKPRISQLDELTFYEIIRNQMTIRLVLDTQRKILTSIEYEYRQDHDGPDPVNERIPG